MYLLKVELFFFKIKAVIDTLKVLHNFRTNKQELIFVILMSVENDIQGGRGHWVVYYTSLQSFIITFSYSLSQQIWRFLLNS